MGTKRKFFKLLVLAFVLMGLSFALGVFFTKKDKPSAPDDHNQQIEQLTAKADSLLGCITRRDSLILSLSARGDSITTVYVAVKEKVSQMHPDEALQYFDDHTGYTSTLAADSSANVSQEGIRAADMLFSQLDYELDMNTIQTQLIGALQQKNNDYVQLDSIRQKTISEYVARHDQDQKALQQKDEKIASQKKTIKYGGSFAGALILIFAIF